MIDLEKPEENQKELPREEEEMVIASTSPEEGETEAAEESLPEESSADSPVAPIPVVAEPIVRPLPAEETPIVTAKEEKQEAVAEEEDSEESEEEEEDSLPKLSPEQEAFPWYVVHTYSGYESRAKLSLEERMRSHDLQMQFGHVLVPHETVVELVRGEKKTSKRKVFPGYILVQMDLNDETWHLVNETPKVTGFVGDTREPLPITATEVAYLTQQMQGAASKPKPRIQFEEGDSIKVIDGPFADFNGTVDEVKPDKGKLRVLISIFGRNTPVELDFVQVEKV